MSNAQIWVSIVLLFLLGEQAIVTWGNRARPKRLPPGTESGRALKEGGGQ